MTVDPGPISDEEIRGLLRTAARSILGVDRGEYWTELQDNTGYYGPVKVHRDMLLRQIGGTR